MSSLGAEPPAGGGAGQCAMGEGGRREVGCQWECPEEEEEEQRREVGCQSEEAEKRDAGVQVDLLTQQISWSHAGSAATTLQSFTVRPDGPDGGALLQHCSSRTRTLRPGPAHTRTLRPGPAHTRTTRTSNRTRRRPARLRGDEDSPEEEETVEEDGDSCWTPAEGDRESSEGAELQDCVSQHASVCVVKEEPDSSVCDVCGKVMKNKASLARHSFIHTGQKPFSCHLCELRFNRRDNLQHHLSHLHPEGAARRQKLRRLAAWLCAVCGKTFSCRSRLRTHEVIHSGVKPHRCDLCPKAYMRTNDLEHHRKVVHVEGGAERRHAASLLCDFCGKEFRSRSQLAVHFQTHTGERPHLCDICGRKFGRQYQLKRHKVLVHANHAPGEEVWPPEAPFPCSVCGKRLKSEALLAAHGRSHSGERPHRCSVCLRGFQRAACLKQHHARVHMKVKSPGAGPGRRRSAAEEKSFSCHVCGKSFRFRSLLASHAATHSDLRPFACDFCSRSFRRLGHLQRHRRVVHADGARLPQSFVCHVCGKDKKCRSQLARHLVIHTGERPYACDLCPARFNRHGNLQQHRRRMHGVGAEPDETPPILFDEDALTYKQEETVVDENQQLDLT